MNSLYYGDNLEVLRLHVKNESVDLIYLDPPFNSKRSYNVLFKEASGAGSQAQIEAFEDTWHWEGAAPAYEEVIALSGFVAMFHRNDHISLFMPLLDIAVRLDDLFQRIDPVNGRFHLARIDQFFEHEQVFELIAPI